MICIGLGIIRDFCVGFGTVRTVGLVAKFRGLTVGICLAFMEAVGCIGALSSHAWAAADGRIEVMTGELCHAGGVGVKGA